MPLALRAYANNADPQKRAEKDRMAFIEDIAEARERLGTIVKSGQQIVLDAEMVVYRQGYLIRWHQVLEARK